MFIYKITHNKFLYDAYDGHIVCANNKNEVRLLAQCNAKDEGQDIWKNAPIFKIGEYKGKHKNPFILLSSFNAG